MKSILNVSGCWEVVGTDREDEEFLFILGVYVQP